MIKAFTNHSCFKSAHRKHAKTSSWSSWMSANTMIISNRKMVILKRPKAIVFEMTGTLVTRDFMAYSETRKNFVRRHINQFFAECYPKLKQLRLNVNFFKNLEQAERKANMYDAKCPTLLDPTRRIPKANSAIEHILYRLNQKNFVAPLTLFMLHMHEWAYQKGIYLTPVYKEARKVLDEWNRQRIPLYVEAASEQFVHLTLSATTAGNLNTFIRRNVSLVESPSRPCQRLFDKLPALFHLPAKDILVITRFPNDLKVALQAGCQGLLLLRDDFEPNLAKLEEQAFAASSAHRKSNITNLSVSAPASSTLDASSSSSLSSRIERDAKEESNEELSSTTSLTDDGKQSRKPMKSNVSDESSTLNVLSSETKKSQKTRKSSSPESSKNEKLFPLKALESAPLNADSESIVQPNIMAATKGSRLANSPNPMPLSSSDLVLRPYGTSVMLLSKSNSSLRARTKNVLSRAQRQPVDSLESLHTAESYEAFVKQVDQEGASVIDTVNSSISSPDLDHLHAQITALHLRQFQYITSLDQIKFE